MNPTDSDAEASPEALPQRSVSASRPSPTPLMQTQTPAPELAPKSASPAERLPDEGELATLSRITRRAFAQMQHMIWVANNRKDKRPGDPKVGGHPASCASAMHVLAGLHMWAREPQDYVCCKPHASPVDHSLHNLLQLFRREDGSWLDAAESARVMYTPPVRRARQASRAGTRGSA